MNNCTISSELRKIREKYGLSLAEMADAVHVKKASFLNWYYGRNEPRDEVLMELQKYIRRMNDEDVSNIPQSVQKSEGNSLLRVPLTKDQKWKIDADSRNRTALAIEIVERARAIDRSEISFRKLISEIEYVWETTK